MEHPDSKDDISPISPVSSWRPPRKQIVVWGLLVALPALLFLFFLADRNYATVAIPRGVTLGGTSLGKLGPAEAHAVVTARAEKLLRGSLAPRLGAAVFELRPPEIAFAVDVPATVARALALGREGGMGKQFFAWLHQAVATTELTPVGTMDRDVLGHLLDLWEAQAGQAPFAGAVVVREGHPVADPPRAGVVVDRVAAHDGLLAALVRGVSGPLSLPTSARPAPLRPEEVTAAVERARRLLAGAVELRAIDQGSSLRLEAADLARALRSYPILASAPALELAFDPATIDTMLAPFRSQAEQPPADATFDVHNPEHVVVVPSRVGTRLDPNAVARALLVAAESPERSGILPSEHGAGPAFPTEEAESLSIRHLVASFTTRHAPGEPRVRNIHRIADLLNGVVVRPGATFSVNAWVGPRTAERGFVLAPSIADGDMVETIGGGVSQFATTLFNALIDGGYEVLERQAHSYYFSRYPRGHEATLSYPKPDLIFRNDTAAGLLLRMEYTDTSIRVLLYGDNGGRKVERRVSPDTDFVRPETIYEPNDDLLPTEEKVLASGAAGWSVTVARLITFPDGTKKEEQRKVTYHPRERRIAVHSCRIPKGQPGHGSRPCPVERRATEAPE